jgi:DNA-binding CsgD family transcriptional regulator
MKLPGPDRRVILPEQVIFLPQRTVPASIFILAIYNHHMDSSDLSPREKEVLRLISQGLRISEAANRLFITEDTVKAHLKSIYRKKGVHNRVQLLLSAAPSNAQSEPDRPSDGRPLLHRFAPIVVIILIVLFAAGPLAVTPATVPATARMTTDSWTIADVDDRALHRTGDNVEQSGELECWETAPDSANQPHLVCE